jgi:TonB family protein
MARCCALCAGVLVALGCSSAQPVAPRSPAQTVAARPPAAAEEEPEGLEEHQIRPVVEAQDHAVRGCHTIEYAGRDTSGGTMTVDLEINPDGTVESVEVVESDFESEPMQRCVKDVTRGLRFPQAEGPTELSWRFRFKAPRG